ncbi:hypothetical protein B7494_g4652 [Chlorociboria aeruginascens]|nr:hypothetical protein B7494_g4652 [Chlorociboria aeruginascens]
MADQIPSTEGKGTSNVPSLQRQPQPHVILATFRRKRVIPTAKIVRIKSLQREGECLSSLASNYKTASSLSPRCCYISDRTSNRLQSHKVTKYRPTKSSSLCWYIVHTPITTEVPKSILRHRKDERSRAPTKQQDLWIDTLPDITDMERIKAAFNALLNKALEKLIRKYGLDYDPFPAGIENFMRAAADFWHTTEAPGNGSKHDLLPFKALSAAIYLYRKLPGSAGKWKNNNFDIENKFLNEYRQKNEDDNVSSGDDYEMEHDDKMYGKYFYDQGEDKLDTERNTKTTIQSFQNSERIESSDTKYIGRAQKPTGISLSKYFARELASQYLVAYLKALRDLRPSVLRIMKFLASVYNSNYWNSPRPTVNNAISQYPSVQWQIIINPDSGPGATSLPDDTYKAAIAQLNAYPNVVTLGYVRTNYTNRAYSSVTADIDIYAGWASYIEADIAVDGIFFDEATISTTAAALQYMEDVSNYAYAQVPSSVTYVIFNPGTSATPTEYFDWADTIVEFEDYYSDYADQTTINTIPASYRANSAIITHDTPISAPLTSLVHTIIADQIEGLYFTSDCCYNAVALLPQLVAAVAAG